MLSVNRLHWLSLVNSCQSVDCISSPLSQIPNYIIALHQLVSLTPSDHVERKSLEHAQSVLEELSTVIV